MKSEVQETDPARDASAARLPRPRRTRYALRLVALAVALLGALLIAGTVGADESAPQDGFELDTTDWQAFAFWSDGAVLWVSDALENEVLAYNLPGGERNPTRDIDVGGVVWSSSGLWSDGATMWIVSTIDLRVFAYSLSTGARQPALDFDLAAAHTFPGGIWSDGTTAWILDRAGKLYAYELSGGARLPSRDIDLVHYSSPWHRPRDLWGNGTTIWVSDVYDRKLRAYELSGGARLPSRDIALHSENDLPSAIWSDGTTMWVSEVGHRLGGTGVTGDVVYSYSVADTIAEPGGVAIYRDASAGAVAARRLTAGRRCSGDTASRTGPSLG